MPRASLAVKISVLIVLVLIVGFGASTILTIQREAALLVEQSKLSARRLTATLVASIEGAMLQERPDVTRTVIVGSRNTIAAPLTQALHGTGYEFISWSDGGAAQHDVIAPATAAPPHRTSTSGSPVTTRASSTGKAPFSRSPTTTSAAHLRPNARSALVPPVRPDPIDRRSGPPTRCATIDPTGTEPAR